ncbi:MAG: hypothetical protein ABW217_03850 [Polyangiaceae bacterium]
MKKLSAEEKLDKLVHMFPHVSEVVAVAACPYGDATHTFSLSRDAYTCGTCSKLDGSECVDEFLAAWDRADNSPDYPMADARVRGAVTTMRVWRKAKR